MIRNIIKLTCKRLPLSVRALSGTPVFSHQNTTTSGSTIDAGEVSNFKKLVGTWWDENGEAKALHSMNVLRVPFVRDGLKNRGMLSSEFISSSTPLKNLNILDVGCGGGILSEPLSQMGANVIGIDACEDLIKCAKLHASENRELKHKINYIHGALEDIVENNKNKFDAVVSSECLEHVAAKESFLKSCADVLKPGGSLFLTTLNKTALSWLLGIIAAEYLLNIVPKGTHDWNKFVHPHEVQKILENNNLQTRVIHGLTYNVIFDKWYWISDTSVNYALHAVKNV